MLTKYKINVPGSTSNLGPGFDFLGLALPLYLTVNVTLKDSGPNQIQRTRTLAQLKLPATRDLFIQAYLQLFGLAGRKAPQISAQMSSQIPIARGLGSSGAAVAAGLLLANTLLDHYFVKEELMQIGQLIEGHPENVAASICGGLVAVCSTAKDFMVGKLPLHRNLHLAIVWPQIMIPTKKARTLLPKKIAYAAAAENPRRLTLLLHGLQDKDAQFIRYGIEDFLHVPYRNQAIPGFAKVVAAGYRAGALGVTISGSGSAMIAFCEKHNAKKILAAMRRAFPTKAGKIEGIACKPELKGGRIASRRTMS